MIPSSVRFLDGLTRKLETNRQVKPFAALLANPNANIPMFIEVIAARLEVLRFEQGGKNLTDTLTLQIEAAKRLPQNIRANKIFSYLPNSEARPAMIRDGSIDPERLSISLIDAIEAIEYNGTSMCVFDVSSDLHNFISGKNAANIARRTADAALKCHGGHAAAAMDLAIELLPKIISHGIEHSSNAFFSDIRFLIDSSLALDAGYRGRGFCKVIQHFALFKNHPGAVSAFCDAIDICRMLHGSEIEPSMLAIHDAIKASGLVGNHWLCYKNAKSVQCIPAYAYKNAHRSIARALPIFDESNKITNKTVADVLAYSTGPDEREDFLRAIEPYFRAGLCPYPS